MARAAGDRPGRNPADPPTQEYRDLWVIRFAADGRCAWFEEWPLWPQQP